MFDIALLDRAINFAAAMHYGQRDKGGMPYICHPLRVMQAVAKYGPEVMAAAVLHDVVEDCENAHLADIRVVWGQRIADAVDALTKRDGEAYDVYLRRVAVNSIAVKVKLADLDDNMNLTRIPNAGPKDEARCGKYRLAKLFLLGPGAPD